MPRVFVSYRRSDSQDVTGRIYDRLEARFGRDNVFFDVDSIPFGVDFRAHLDAAVGQCDVLLAVIGDGWLEQRYESGARQGQRRIDDARDFVRIEIESALARGIPVIPVLVGRAEMPSEEVLPESLRPLAFRHAAAVRSGSDFGDHVARLIRGLEHLLNAKQPAAAASVAAATPLAKAALAESFENSIGMKFVLVRPGKFLMGSPADEEPRESNEQQHEVTITKPFYLGVCPVTVGHWKRFASTGYRTVAERGGGAIGWTGSTWEKDQRFSWQSPGFSQHDGHPVTCVSWNDAAAFCEWLKTAGSDHAYRLPTEAEWEYSCRGGASSSPLPFHFAHPTSALSSMQANFNGEHSCGGATQGPFRKGTTPVGSFGEASANSLGLFDMHGNVWEWCLDWYDASYSTVSPAADPSGPAKGSERVVRGGSWADYGRHCRAVSRLRFAPSATYDFLGFRVAAVPHE